MPRIGIRDLKTHASDVLRDVCDNRARYVVTRQVEPPGIIVPYTAREETEHVSPDEAWSRFLEAGEAADKAWTSPLTSREILDEVRR
jgi:antitoxin (DNA-binding transcriptional repressor) of toxin-antitoxin stability system